MARTSKKKRSLAARKGWATRRRHERERAALKEYNRRKRKAKRSKRTRPKQAKRVDHIVTVKFTTREKGRPREYIRDIIIPGRPGATFSELKREALETAGPSAEGLIRRMRANEVTIVQGPPTRRRKAEIR